MYRAVIILGAFILLGQSAWSQDDWKLRRDKKGIKIYTRDSKKQSDNIKASKAVMHVEADVNDVMQIVTDVTDFPNWVPRCEQTYVVEKSESELIYYAEYGAAMVTNRELVVGITCSVLEDGNGKCILKNKPQALEAADKNIRIPDFYGEWDFIREKDGSLRVENWYKMDPGGNIPDWMVNLSSVDSPFDTFVNLKELIKSRGK
jgi:ribosome-associated toxin RatA of RatAB toxin-antitoxin module